jgi:hypothetical protein
LHGPLLESAIRDILSHGYPERYRLDNFTRLALEASKTSLRFKLSLMGCRQSQNSLQTTASATAIDHQLLFNLPKLEELLGGSCLIVNKFYNEQW